ncbi:MAG: O-antigen ligase family protein [Candidatus Moraniibacteriota bacterium]
MILIPGLLIGLWDILKSKKINFFKLIYLLPILVTIFFTHSYGAWFAIIFSTLLLLFFTHKRLILFFLILIFTLILAEYPSEKFQHLSNFQIKSSTTSRIVIWQSAKKIIADHWFWGIGAGNFQEKYLAYQPYFKPYPEWAVPQPHNLFLAFWLQTGLLGLGGFLYLLISWGTKIIKILIFSKDFYQKRFSLLIFVLFFSHLIYGLIDTPYWKNDLSLIFWTIIYLGLQLEFLSRPLDDNSK